MFAIVELGGKQYQVKEKDILRIEQLNLEPGAEHKVERVLLTAENGNIKIGTPFVKSAYTLLKILENGKNPKVYTFKMKAKKRYKRQKNWRQPYTEVEVVKISA